MSFSAKQKEGIIEKTYKSVCCRRALLLGVLYAKGELDNDAVSISIEKESTAVFISKLIKEFFGKDAVIYHPEIGGRRVLIEFTSKSAQEYICNIADTGNLFTRKCESCQSSFLRGIFLAAGRAADPKMQYSLEFSVKERAKELSNYLIFLGLNPRISRKKSGEVVYFKDSEMIEDFYALSGMNGAMFSLIDAKAEGELRKNVGRIANCETNNIKKAIDTAAKQISVISALNEANLLSSLPEELAATALLRLEHKDLSLAQLAAISVPAISKPGLSHRLKKIMELGTQLLSTSHKE